VAEKKGEEVGEKSEANRVLAKVEEKAAGNNAGGVSIGKSFRPGENWNDTVFTLTSPVSFVQPWLPFCRELCASSSTNARSFCFALQLWPLS